MRQVLRTITGLSHEFGTAEYVLGGGGNTSCKNEDTLWIKPSGTTLASLTPEAFIAIDRRRLEELYALETLPDPAAREALVKRVTAAAVSPATPGRASVEVPVHNSFRARYVVHTHPTLVNGLTCALGGRAAARRLIPDALWLDYTDPGYTLGLRVHEALAEYRRSHEDREPRVMLIANHGIFVAGDTAADIRESYGEVIRSLKREYRRLDLSLGLPEPHVLRPVPTKSEYETAVKVLRRALRPGEAEAVVARAPMEPAAGPVSPDHLVYAKAYPYEGVLTSEAVGAFVERRGYAPRIVSTPGGFYTCGATEAIAERAAIFAIDAMTIRHLARAFGGIQYLDDAARIFLENWEAESYRAALP